MVVYNHRGDILELGRKLLLGEFQSVSETCEWRKLPVFSDDWMVKMNKLKTDPSGKAMEKQAKYDKKLGKKPNKFARYFQRFARQIKPSLRSRRLEVEAQEKTLEREGETRVSLARPRSLFSPTTSKPATQAKTNPPRITLAPLTCFSFSLMMCKWVVHGFSAMRILAALLARTAACN